MDRLVSHKKREAVHQCEDRCVPLLSSEAVVLRTWPVREADLVVSFFSRDYGRLKGIAKSALKSRKRFGGALEPMTVARAWFAERPRQELVRLDQLEILASPLSEPVDMLRATILSFYAELIDECLPERDPQATVFRLLASVLDQTHAQREGTVSPWMPLTYFQLWMTRLTGLLPSLTRCTACHAPLQEGATFFLDYTDGLFCPLHRGASAQALSADSWQLAQRMLRAPVASFVTEPFPRRRAQDLRRFAMQSMERHLEKRLRSAEALSRLGG